MAPLYKAINVNYASKGDGVQVYEGNIDGDWTIGA
jgi:hypothetical protein